MEGGGNEATIKQIFYDKHILPFTNLSRVSLKISDML